MTLESRVQKIFRHIDRSIPPGEAPVGQAFLKARGIVQYYYYHLLFLAVLFLPWWDPITARKGFSPLWPIAWSGALTLPVTIEIVRLVFLGGALVGAFFYWHRLGRIAGLLGILQFHALESSFGQPNHQWYLWLYTAILFLFFSDVWGKTDRLSADTRKKFLTVFWGGQALVLLTYSLSGLGKLMGALQQLAAGQVNSFSPTALSLLIADWLPQMQARTVLGSVIIEHPWLGWPLYLGAWYFQLFALVAAFRPSIQKLWAVGLILFHIGTYLTMEIYFLPPVLLLLLLFFDSPFRSPHTTGKDVLTDLPLFGWALRRIFRPGEKS